MLSYVLLVYLNQLGDIVKVLDIIPPVPFGAVPGLLYKVLNGQALILCYYAFIKKAINLKRLVFVSVTIYKHQGGLL